MTGGAGFPKLYPILDAGYLPVAGRAEYLARLVGELADAGVGILQYRNKRGGAAEVLADARVMRAAAGERMLLVMNDWPRLAMEAGLDGVHVGQTDMSAAEARAIVGPERVVGVSTHSEAQLRAADAAPVDYVAIGPVYATATKEDTDPVVGLEGVRAARGLTRKPLVAIGGIAVEDAAAVWAAGADSVAVISAVFGPVGDAAARAREFLRRASAT
ncbi:MAG TPA: thiamine phosphate synthase [Acidobacteriaceae bacterium]|nr:thiamine phosphate synthase [Acidobacteriaceae bacterium]